MLILEILNDGTGTKKIGNYRYKVMVNHEVIDEGVIIGHDRENGWRNLVRMVISDSLARSMGDADLLWGGK